MTFKNCAPFTESISETNNIQIDNAKDIDAVIPMYNLTEYSHKYLKTSGSFWQYYKDEPNDNIVNSFKSNYYKEITDHVNKNRLK